MVLFATSLHAVYVGLVGRTRARGAGGFPEFSRKAPGLRIYPFFPLWIRNASGKEAVPLPTC